MGVAMKINEELRTFTDDATRLALKMTVVVDHINMGLVSAGEGGQRLDQLAREMIGIQETIKDLAYRFSRGEDRVTTVEAVR